MTDTTNALIPVYRDLVVSHGKALALIQEVANAGDFVRCNICGRISDAAAEGYKEPVGHQVDCLAVRARMFLEGS